MKIRQSLVLATVMAMTLAMLAAAQTDQKPLRVRISSGAADKLKIHDVTPTYPKDAKERLIEGTVLLLATIDVHGNVINLKLQQGDPILTEAAMDAVKQWKYKPYQIKG